MHMNISRTKEKLRRGETVFGTLSLIPEPSLAELAGAAGMDFFVIDTEHAAADGRTVENMVRAAQAAGITPIVRSRYVEEKNILWILDSGAEGLMLPLIESAETARQAYRMSRYPPDGDRTLCSATRVAGRGAYRKNFQPFVEHVNREMLLIGLIETPEGLANAKAIAREGIDIFIPGRADLSMKMGFHYAPNHRDVIAASERMLQDIMAEGKTAGILAYDLDDAKRWMDFGCKFIIYSQPELLLAAHYAETMKAMTAYASQASGSAVASDGRIPAAV